MDAGVGMGLGACINTGLGIMIAGTGGGWEIFLKWCWDGVGINCVGTGGDGDYLVIPCRPLQYNHHDQERIKISY